MSEQFPVRRPTRRGFLLGALGLGTAALVAACSQPQATSTSATTGPAPTTAASSAPTTAASSSAPAPAATTAPGGATKLTITFWNDIGATNAKPYTDLQTLFDKQTGIKINQQVMQIGNLNSKLQMSAPIGQGPDMALLYTTAIPHFADLGTIQELDPAALEQNGIKESDYAKATWDGGMYKGKRYSITQDVVQSVLFLNDKMFQAGGLADSNGKPQAPTDQNSYLEAAKKLTKNGAFGGLWGGGNDYQNFEGLLWQNQTNVFSSDLGKCILDQPPAIEVAQFWGTPYAKLKVSPPDGVDAEKAFVAGKLAMWLSGSWSITGFTEAKIPFTVAPVPTLFKTNSVWSLGHELTMPVQKNKNDAKISAYWQFVKFMIKNGATWTIQGGVLAANNSVYSDPRIANDPTLKVLTGQAKNWGIGQRTPEWSDAETLIGPAIDAVYVGKKQPDEAMKSLATQIDGLSS